MADFKIELTAKSANKSRVVSAFKGLYPVPQEPKDPADPAGELQNKYTDDEWVTERVKQFVRDTVLRHEQRAAMDTAKDGVSVPENIVA